MPVILLEFSMTPLTKGESVSKYVARSLDIIDKSGLEYRLNPMGTVIEGEWDEVFDVVRKCLDRFYRNLLFRGQNSSLRFCCQWLMIK